jgi:hypothetical protein
MSRADKILTKIEETGKLPERTLDTLSDAIALGSPSGSMSKRAREAAQKRLGEKLFGKGGLQKPVRVTNKKEQAEGLLRHAKLLRELAERGMNPRSGPKQAAKLEADAEKLLKEAEKEEKS